MDLVAITDHDSIDGALELLERLRTRDDVIVGEEVSCWLPDGDIEVHLGVYGMTEALHRDLQPLRRNVVRRHCAPARGRRVLRAESSAAFLSRADAARRATCGCSTRCRRSRSATARCCRRTTCSSSRSRAAVGRGRGGALAAVGGSDAHTLRRVGTTWTEAPGRNREEFLSSLARGLGRPGGRHGGARRSPAMPTASSRAYVASLLGFGPSRSRWLASRRAASAFAGVSLPFQFLPLAIALAGKRARAREGPRGREPS